MKTSVEITSKMYVVLVISVVIVKVDPLFTCIGCFIANKIY